MEMPSETPAEVPSSWMVYFNVSDVDAAFTRAIELGATELVQLSADATEALEALARRRHLTVSTFVQGAWGILLARHAAQTDVLFGVTVSGRPPDLPGVERMLGLFINTLPLRLDTSDTELLPWLRPRLEARRTRSRRRAARARAVRGKRPPTPARYAPGS